jgi:cysteine-rich repeat protein
MTLAVLTGCFDASFDNASSLSCRDGNDCHEASICLNNTGRCIQRDVPCIAISGREASAVDDGVACEVGRICVSAACVEPRCGDGIISGVETCDGGEGCRADCTRCGDGVIDDDEDCDDGAANSDVDANACRTSCVSPSCGDGVRDAGEGCDDGAANSDVDADACRSSCARASCGDGVIDNDEDCDGDAFAAGSAAEACRSDCGEMRCGDGVIDVDNGEVCDDGNNNPRDGCASCQLQGWSSTVVVGGVLGSPLAQDANFVSLDDIAVDLVGRLYLADGSSRQVHRINVDGTITTIAGTGDAGFAGDGGPATSAALGSPVGLSLGVAVDASGRVVIADGSNRRVRRVDVDGTITTIAGTGEDGLSGDGGPATRAALGGALKVAVDAAGRVVIADIDNGRVRRVELDGTIITIAGNGTSDFSGDGGPATSAGLGFLGGIAADAAGRLFVVDGARGARVRRIDTDGIITTVAGNGTRGFSGDGGPATDAELGFVSGIAVDGAGQLLIADGRRVRRVDVLGTIATVAGTGEGGFSGDGGPAISATFGGSVGGLSGVVVDAASRVVVADEGNRRLRRIDTSGTITTIAGTGGSSSFSGDGGSATSAGLNRPQGVAIDAAGQVVFSDTSNHRIRRIDAQGIITTIAGTGAGGSFAGDGGPAINARINFPFGVVVDAAGRVVFADSGNHSVRRVESDGTITTIAGTGEAGFSGDGEAATSATLHFPTGVAVDGAGRVLFADANNHRIRRVELDGTINTIAGTGAAAFLGDGGPAESAALNLPVGVAVDAAGLIFIADRDNGRVRRIDVDGTITTVPGTGSADAVAIDAAGNVFVADLNGNRVRRVALDGSVTVIGGSGADGLSGDGGPATSAGVGAPGALAIDGAGHVVIALRDSSVIRRVETDGTMTTIAGRVHPPGPGFVEGAKLYAATELVPVASGGLISVGAFGRGLHVALDQGRVDVVIGYGAQPSPSASGQARFAQLLDDARGVAFDAVDSNLVITEHGSGALRVIGLDVDDDGVIDDADRWTNARIATDLVGPAGIDYDLATDTFVVADEADHCVKRVGRDGVTLETIFGRCGGPGLFPGFLNAPAHVVVWPDTGAVYVADTGNDRVLRVQGGAASVVIGDGSVSSAGEGAPARLFPVNAPGQLAFDAFGNLYVASTTTLRLVANVDGDDDVDGDDRVFTIFGGGARDAFPESDTFCLKTVVVNEDGRVFAADACQGFMVELIPQ